jgi:hypothetical protein
VLAGHYAAAYALKAARPAVPLWALFVAVQAVDVVFFVLALTGVETLAVNHGEDGPLAMNLVHIPFTHSLALNLAYAAGLIAAGLLARRTVLGMVLAAALVSHWSLDLFVHLRDLPLTIAATTKVGMGLWRYPIPALMLEVGLVLMAYAMLRRRLSPGPARRWADGGAVLLVAIQLAYVLGPAPTTVLQMALAAEAIYVIMAVLAYQVDRRSS